MKDNMLRKLKILESEIFDEGYCNVARIFGIWGSCEPCPLNTLFCDKFDGNSDEFASAKKQFLARYIKELELNKMEELLNEE